MKTPKRYICPARDELCGRAKPCFPWNERGIPDRHECARWKRKNREKQLKRSIARLQQQVRHLKRRRHQALRIITRWRAWSNKVYEWKENTMTAFRRCFSALCYQNDIQNASGTYGHGIEGS